MKKSKLKKRRTSEEVAKEVKSLRKVKKKGLKPIVSFNTKILILGILPSDESIKQQKYYAKQSNDFWKLISKVISEDVTRLCYDDKIKRLIKHGIGLWDVLKACERKGNSDSNITKEEKNDFSKLKRITPDIRLICFNGRKAGSYETFLQKIGYKTKILPSSSGANRKNNRKRISEWKSILELSRKRRTTEQVIKDEMKNGKIKIVYGWENWSCGKSPLTIEEGIAKIMGDL